MKRKHILSLGAAGVTGLALVLAAAGALVTLGGGSQAVAADSLPAGFAADSVGAGGLDPASVRSIAVASEYEVWTARDRASNVCVIATALPPGGVTSTCVAEQQFRRAGVPLPKLAAPEEQDDSSATYVQALLLPEEGLARLAAQQVDGAVTKGALVVPRGPRDSADASAISPPSSEEVGARLVFVG